MRRNSPRPATKPGRRKPLKAGRHSRPLDPLSIESVKRDVAAEQLRLLASNQPGDREVARALGECVASMLETEALLDAILKDQHARKTGA